MSKFIVKFHNWFERAMQPRLRNMVGLDEYFREPQERIETLEYIIDHSLDITKMAKASGEQRQMQKCVPSIISLIGLIGVHYWVLSGMEGIYHGTMI